MGNAFLDILKKASGTGTASASINNLNHLTTLAIVRAAERANRDVIIQPSSATVKRYGVKAMRAMVRSLSEDASVRIALHLDHCRDDGLLRACADAGWDSVMCDFSALPLEENIARTGAVVRYAHERGVAVEGEIGLIAGVEDDVSHEKGAVATLEDTLRFCEQTGVDAIAPAIGTAHGVYKSAPKLNFDLVEAYGRRRPYLVVHGGTGLSEETFRRLIRLGAAKINISTALKQVYLNSSRELLTSGEKLAPVDFDFAVCEKCSERMEQFIRLFANEDVKL